MSGTKSSTHVAVALSAIIALTGSVALAQEAQTMDPGKTQFAPAAEWVRVASNNIGYAIVGYRTANNSVGQEWLMLEVGLTVPKGIKNQVLQRDAFSISTPDNEMIPMASQKEFQDDRGKLRALDARASVERDSINYFPPVANNPCRIGFFTDASQPGRGMAYDQVELSYNRACVGRLYFKVPGGIQYGQHTLNVRFYDGMLRVPFKIMTTEEMKELKKEIQQMEKEAKQKKKDAN